MARGCKTSGLPGVWNNKKIQKSLKNIFFPLNIKKIANEKIVIANIALYELVSFVFAL